MEVAISLHLITFMTVSSQFKFLLTVLNFVFWDTVREKAKINTPK